MQRSFPTDRRMLPSTSSYLFEAAHEVVANRRAWQVCSAGAAPHIEEVIRTQHGVVFLGVACRGEDPIH